LVVIVEVQRGTHPDKRYSWPAYVALLRARFRCEVRLLVVATKRHVARWCARPIDIGGGAVFTPTVLGPNLIPVVTDRDQAGATPELAVLSAMAHGRGDHYRAVAIGIAGLSAVERLESERGMLYLDLILTALSETARKAIEAMIPQGYKWQSDFAQKHRAEGRLEGKAEGKAEGRAEAVVSFLEARGVAMTSAERNRILGCADLETLERWIRRAAVVASAHELFA
jgi:hypothetical protein